MWYGDDRQTLDAGEVCGIAREQRQVIGDGHSRDHRVVRPGRRLSARPPQRMGDTGEGPGCSAVEWQRIEVCFSKLKVALADGPFLIVTRQQRPDAELCECDAGDEWCGRQRRLIGDAVEKDENARVEQSSVDRHNVLSISSSRSRRRAAGSSGGKCR